MSTILVVLWSGAAEGASGVLAVRASGIHAISDEFPPVGD